LNVGPTQDECQAKKGLGWALFVGNAAGHCTVVMHFVRYRTAVLKLFTGGLR